LALSLWHIEGWTPRAHIDLVGRAAVLRHVEALVLDLVGHAEEAGSLEDRLCGNQPVSPTPSSRPNIACSALQLISTQRATKNGNIRNTTQAVMTTCADEEVSRAVAASN
jgi:hypothetical protein